MSTRKMTANLRLTRWSQILRERTESDLSVKAYCEKEEASTKTRIFTGRRKYVKQLAAR